MKFNLKPVAFAVCSALPLAAAHAAPKVAFVAPANGATISGTMNQSSACEVKGTSDIRRVVFYLDGTTLNTESGSPWTCNLDTSRFSNGTHTLRARAYDSRGASTTTQISVNIQNGGSSGGGGTPTNPPPSVSFNAPASGATISGHLETCQVTATDADGVKQVQWYLDSTLVNTEMVAPYDSCNLDTTKFANGTHVLRAVATDSKGATGSAQLSVNIQNGGSGGGGTPAPSGPTVSFKTPANGSTISSPISQSSACEALVASGTSMKQVQFFLGSTLLNTEGSAPWTCNIDPAKFQSGSYPLKAVATDTAGGSGSAEISVSIQNGSSGGGSTNPAPSVSFTAPASGTNVTGYLTNCKVTATDSDGVKQLQWYLDNTLINTEMVAPYDTCKLDSTKFANGAHVLKAVATDSKGATGSAQLAINIQNGTSGGGDGGGGDSGGGSGGGSLPSTNTKAVATFESMGLYWKPPSNPGSAGCDVRFRKVGDSAWKQGLAMWYDSRDSECRGSLVHLSPGTEYEVQFAMPGKAHSAGLKAKTWSEQFPIAQTVQVQSGSQTLNITQGGTKDGYVLYTGPATIDVANAKDFNVTISAPYVIVRGLTLKGAKVDGIRLLEGAHDVVIEDSDISEWGTYRTTNSEGWKLGVNAQAGISAWCRSGPWLERLVVQRTKIHHPRYGSNSWSDGHPLGPNAILFHECGGNHVFRHNEIYSEAGRYFMDGIGGEENFSTKGMPNADSDVYGNVIKHTWDDAIEAEGANKNVRIWGNYFDQTTTGIATTITERGPVYIFRNVYNRSRMLSKSTLDADTRNLFFKSGTKSGYGDGRRYVFHNTMLQAPPISGTTLPLGGGGGLAGPNSNDKLTNTVSRNNIFHIWKTWWPSIDTKGGANNDLDYDLVNGNVTAYSGAEPNRVVGVPIYLPGHGWANEANGQYQLAPGSPGHGRGVKIPNFNDGASAPDMGAHQSGAPAMKFGVK